MAFDVMRNRQKYGKCFARAKTLDLDATRDDGEKCRVRAMASSGFAEAERRDETQQRGNNVSMISFYWIRE